MSRDPYDEMIEDRLCRSSSLSTAEERSWALQREADSVAFWIELGFWPGMAWEIDFSGPHWARRDRPRMSDRERFSHEFQTPFVSRA